MSMISSATSFLTIKHTFHDSTDSARPTLGILCAQRKQKPRCSISFNLKDHDRLHRTQNKYTSLHCENNPRHRPLQLLVSAKAPDKDSCPKYFPKFVKEGSQSKIDRPKDYKQLDQGIMYRDIAVGKGECIGEKERVSFLYNRYDRSCNLRENANFEGSLTELTNKFGPGLKKGIQDMRPGGKRMIIIPPSVNITKEYQVFEVEVPSIKKCTIWNLYCRL